MIGVISNRICSFLSGKIAFIFDLIQEAANVVYFVFEIIILITVFNLTCSPYKKGDFMNNICLDLHTQEMMIIKNIYCYVMIPSLAYICFIRDDFDFTKDKTSFSGYVYQESERRSLQRIKDIVFGVLYFNELFINPEWERIHQIRYKRYEWSKHLDRSNEPVRNVNDSIRHIIAIRQFIFKF
jgi:hypothetical protein